MLNNKTAGDMSMDESMRVIIEEVKLKIDTNVAKYNNVKRIAKEFNITPNELTNNFKYLYRITQKNI